MKFIYYYFIINIWVIAIFSDIYSYYHKPKPSYVKLPVKYIKIAEIKIKIDTFYLEEGEWASLYTYSGRVIVMRAPEYKLPWPFKTWYRGYITIQN